MNINIEELINEKPLFVSDQTIVRGAYKKAKELLGDKYNKTQCMIIGYRLFKKLPLTKELVEKDVDNYKAYKAEQEVLESKRMIKEAPLVKEVYRAGKLLDSKAVDILQFYSIATEVLVEDIDEALNDLPYSEVKNIGMMEESDLFSFDGVEYDIQVNISYKNGSSCTSLTAINKSTNERYYDSYVN